MISELGPGGPVVDVVAISLAVSSGRPVPLNRTERLLAAALILAGGGRQADICQRLGISSSEASRMATRIRSAVSARAA